MAQRAPGMPGSADSHGALAALRLLTCHRLLPADVHNVLGPMIGGLPCPPYYQLPPPPLPTIPPLPPIPVLPPIPPPMLSPPLCESDIRRRGEKRPIPAEMKDDKYFERRRRNNQAAKKSRDARRIREDQIAWRACLLEQENACLRAHAAALRQETVALRSLLDQRLPSSTTQD